ncbi:8232_t:CDS:10 [Entrophospora sp. SA101]|nr:8232_t:CDS:10 [Entrophospora sp. SA101]
MEQLNNITIWDVKDAFNKVKNVVMNYTEMEAKVREATNNEPWGASSTLMLEIAQATYNYQCFNEIMTTIYKRFIEKEARYWRQIYKALQLLEYLVKHGSERVVDDARAHIASIKVMKSFSYFDEKGKDQGLSGNYKDGEGCQLKWMTEVRNRAKELSELLNDVEKIRAERKKARANRAKYTGVSSGSVSYGDSFSRGGGFGTNGYYGGGGTSNGIGRSSADSNNRNSLGSSKANLFDFEDSLPNINNDYDNDDNKHIKTNSTDFDFQSATSTFVQSSSSNLAGIQTNSNTKNTTSNNNKSMSTLKSDDIWAAASTEILSLPVKGTWTTNNHLNNNFNNYKQQQQQQQSQDPFDLLF